jgi:Mrp family chromosome partitioning ATPase
MTAELTCGVLGQYRVAFETFERHLGGAGVIGVISPGRLDGGSAVATDLAVAVAQEIEGRVLLLDLDLEGPGEWARFGVPVRQGLHDCLDEPWRLDAVTVCVRPSLWVVPAGRGTLEQGADLLRRVVGSRLLDSCRTTFTWTIVGFPPILDVPGGPAAAAHVDGCLLAGRYRITRVDALEAAARSLPRPPIGFVMIDHH